MTTLTPRFRALFASLSVLALGACASTSMAPAAPTAQATGAEARVRDPAGSSVFGLYLAGEAAIDRGSSRDAAFYFAKSSALDPDSQNIRNRAFTAALVAGEVSQAARIAAYIPDGTDPIEGLARLTRAVEAISQDRGHEALALLTSTAASPPHAAAAALLRPWAAAQAGDWKTAEAAPASAGNSVLSTVAALGRAELLERDGKLDEAERAFKAHATPKNGLFVLGYGGFLERRSRYDDAIALYQRSLTAKPDDVAFARAKARASVRGTPPSQPTLKEGAAEALVAPAVLMLAEHQGDSGLGYLRLALKLDGKLDEAWILVGDAMTTAGDPEAAREAYSHVKAGSEQFAVARGDLALALQKAGDKDGALALTRETMQSAPQDPRLLTLYADLLSDDDRYEDAAAALSTAISAVGEAKAGWSLYYLRGASEERAGRWPAAEADLKRSLALNPDEPEVMNYLGYAWVDRGEHLPEALSLLEKAEANTARLRGYCRLARLGAIPHP